ncbi:MAG: glutamine amidotransferase [Gammaproteobacteria bacterium]|jgi:GMP synthase (glutamine-hydrolysing)|nr:glutamine amidotransferase [Gammaproteobacteria bacterium]HJO10597.1 glutamine amidotransferase [Gammaproteobacteria bacterium]
MLEMNSGAKKILIMKTGSTVPMLLDTSEDFEDWIIRYSGSEKENFLTCAVHLNEKLPDITNISGMIITGSPAFLTDLDPWNQVAADYIRECYRQEVPVLGICYGHQLLAWAFGGKVDFHSGGREIGTVNIRITGTAKTDSLFKEMPADFMAHVSHSQSVITLPEGAVLLAENDFDPHHGFRLGNCLWGIQFHPEFNSEITRVYIEERKTNIEAEGLDTEKLLSELTVTPEATGLLSRFVDFVAKKAS